MIANSRALGAALTKRGYKLVTGGTGNWCSGDAAHAGACAESGRLTTLLPQTMHCLDNHLVLWDLRPEGVTGSKMEKACDLCHITLNKNAGELPANGGGRACCGRICVCDVLFCIVCAPPPPPSLQWLVT